MGDMKNATEEEMDLAERRAANRKGATGAIADFFDPSTRKAAEAAKMERARRAAEAAANARKQAEPPPKEITFKRGGAVKARGDGIASRGKTRGTMR